jgi:hypothetical protein
MRQFRPLVSGPKIPVPGAVSDCSFRSTPPTSPLLFEYGRDFPLFIESYEYAQGMPWLADTARIERLARLKLRFREGTASKSSSAMLAFRMVSL